MISTIDFIQITYPIAVKSTNTNCMDEPKRILNKVSCQNVSLQLPCIYNSALNLLWQIYAYKLWSRLPWHFAFFQIDLRANFANKILVSLYDRFPD